MDPEDASVHVEKGSHLLYISWFEIIPELCDTCYSTTMDGNKDRNSCCNCNKGRGEAAASLRHQFDHLFMEYSV